MNTPRWIICHHTGAENSFETDNDWHRQKWNFKSQLGFFIGYHFYIDRDGTIHQGRNCKETGAHTKGMNTSSIGIALQGNFNKRLPTTKQEKSLRGLLTKLVEKYDIPLKRIVPHRFFSDTECYGDMLDDSWARELVEDKQVKIELLKKKIGIIEKLIQVYIRLITILKGR